MAGTPPDDTEHPSSSTVSITVLSVKPPRATASRGAVGEPGLRVPIVGIEPQPECDADVGPNPGGGFYTGPNINVGQINPPSFYQSQELAERPR